jgi:hypothetical protein
MKFLDFCLLAIPGMIFIILAKLKSIECFNDLACARGNSKEKKDTCDEA